MAAAIAKLTPLRRRRPVRHVLVALGALAMCMPPHTSEALSSDGVSAAREPAARQTAAIADVALTDGGTFRGLLVDAQQIPQSGIGIELRCGGRQLGRVVTGPAGRFAITGLRGGLYQLTTPQSSRLVRLWTRAAAPPSARQAAVLVVPRTVVRGQSSRSYRFSSDALLLGTIVTAGATIPWIINGSRSNDSSGS